MGFFEDLKVKNLARKMGFTVEEYNTYLEVQNFGISESQYRKWLSEFKNKISLNDYAEYVKIENTGITVEEFFDYQANYKSIPSPTQYLEYKRYCESRITAEEYLEINKIKTEMSLQDKIEYFKNYRDKISPENYLNYKESLKLGFDLDMFLSYISLEDDISIQDYLIEQKLLKAGVSQKDIKAYFAKYADLTVEQYIEYLSLDHKIVTIKDYQKYIDEYSKVLNIESYVEYCKAKKTKYSDFLGKKKAISDDDALIYAKNSDKISLEKMIEYYENNYCDIGFYYLNKLQIEAYISYIEKEKKIYPDDAKLLSVEDRKKQYLKITRHIIDFCKNYIRENSIINAGVLKKYTGQELMLFCIPDEVIEIADGAFETSSTSVMDVLFHNHFKKMGESENLHISRFGTFIEDERVQIYEYSEDFRFPDTMEDISSYTLLSCDNKIMAPTSMKSCEALSNKEIEWFDPNTGNKSIKKEAEEIRRQRKAEEKEQFIKEYNRKCYVVINLSDKKVFYSLSQAISYAEDKLKMYGYGFARFFDDNEEELYELFMSCDENISNDSKALSSEKTTKVKTNSSVKKSQPKGEKVEEKTNVIASKAPKKSGNKKYEDIISKLKIDFPFEREVHLRRNDTDRINNRLEKMAVGERLALAPEKPVHREDNEALTVVYDQDGLMLGWCCSDDTNAALYKIKDIIFAEVIDVTPVSQRRKGSKYSLLRVKIDYDFDGPQVSAPKLENKYTVKYSADGKSGSKKFPDLYAAQRYVEHLLDTTENGYAQILDEDGNAIPDEGAVWC